MKRWTRVQINRLAKERLTPAEWKLWNISEGRTIKEYRKRSYYKAKPFEKVVGCSCWQSIHQEFIEAIDALGKIMGEIIKWELLHTDTSLGREWRTMKKKIAMRYGRQRRCHVNKKGFICYCDEHSH